MATRILLLVFAVLIGLSAASGVAVQAEPTNPSPGPTTTSTDDELVDMVMDAIQNGAAEPATTPAPAPPH